MSPLERVPGFKGLRDAVTSRLPHHTSEPTAPVISDAPIEPLIDVVEDFLSAQTERIVFEPAPIVRGSFDLNRVQNPHVPPVVHEAPSLLFPDGEHINATIFQHHSPNVRLVAERQSTSPTTK